MLTAGDVPARQPLPRLPGLLRRLHVHRAARVRPQRPRRADRGPAGGLPAVRVACRVPGLLRGWTGLFAGAVASAVLFVGIAAGHVGWPAIVAAHDGAASPYRLIPDGVLVGLMLAVIAYSLLIGALAARSYWAATGSRTSRSARPTCCGPPGTPSPALSARRRCRLLLPGRRPAIACLPRPAPAHVAGFGLCIASTAAAAVLQDILGEQPPTPACPPWSSPAPSAASACWPAARPAAAQGRSSKSPASPR